MSAPSSSAIALFAGAAIVGSLVGVGSLAATSSGREALAGVGRRVGGAIEVKRSREPRPGDHWPGCNEARAAGTAPIYRGEPGYRGDMDGDDDGIACEPHRD